MNLELRNCKYDYEPICYEEFTETNTYNEDDENVVFIEYIKSKVYVNKERRQSIIANECRFEGEDFYDYVDEIFNAISDEAYDYLIDTLNMQENITVYCSQIYGTTMDYSIITNHYFTNRQECQNYIEEHSTIGNYKYTYYNKNDIECKLDC